MEMRQQPFFKPLDGQSLQAEKANRGISFFAPLHQQSRVQEQSKQGEVNKEKMSSLHTKLFQEAEKIRKWKTQTEIEIKQKDKKLREASNTIDSLRKSILEVQLQNENLSMKFQEELENRQEIQQKINATRDMCNLLKEYSSKVDERIELCEGDRTDLKHHEKDQQKKFQELTEKFVELEITATQEHNNLLNQVQAEQEDKKQIKEQYEKMIQETKQELENLSKQCTMKEERIAQITQAMAMVEEKLGILKVQHAFLQEQFQAMEASNVNLNSKLSSTNLELDGSKELTSRLEQALTETSAQLRDVQHHKDTLERQFVETESMYVEKVKTLKEECAGLTGQIEKEKKRLEDLEKALCNTEQTLEETKCSKDMLLLERTSLQAQLSKAEDKEATLTKVVTEKEGQITELTSDISERKEQMNQMLVTKRELEEEGERLKKELQEALQNEKQTYEMVDDLKSKFENTSEQNQSTSDKLKGANSENKALTKKINSLEKEINSLKDNLEKNRAKEVKTQDKLKETELHLESMRERLKEVEEQKDETKANLEEESSNVQDLQKELEKKTKEVDALDAKTKSMKSDITAKNKQIKELEKEARSMKGKFTAKEKADVRFEEAHEQVKWELTVVREEADQLKAQYEEQSKANEELGSTVESLKKEAKRAQDEKVKLTKEQEAAKKGHDGEMAKMVSLLEEYKLMNQTTVEEKQKEIEKVVKTSKGQEEKQKEQIKELKKEIKKLEEQEKKIAAQEKEIEESREKNTQQEEEIAALKKSLRELEDLKEKETEVEKLRMEIEHLKVASSKTTVKAPVTAGDTGRSAARGKENQVWQEALETPRMKAPTSLRTPIATQPRTPKPSQPKTPLATMNTGMVTPRQSIIRESGESEIKRRKVMFSGVHHQNQEDPTGDYDSDVSSSSELMEMDGSQLELKLRTPMGKLKTPVIFKKSPSVRPATSEKVYKKATAVTPVQKPSVNEKKKLTPKPAANLKKAPGKQTNKFFKTTSPHEKRRMALGRKPKAPEDLAWFDSDAVFGFDAED